MNIQEILWRLYIIYCLVNFLWGPISFKIRNNSVSINLFENSIHCPPEFIGFFQVHRNLGSQIVFDYWCGLLYANLAQNKPHSTKASADHKEENVNWGSAWLGVLVFLFPRLSSSLRKFTKYWHRRNLRAKSRDSDRNVSCLGKKEKELCSLEPQTWILNQKPRPRCCLPLAE